MMWSEVRGMLKLQRDKALHVWGIARLGERTEVICHHFQTNLWRGERTFKTRLKLFSTLWLQQSCLWTAYSFKDVNKPPFKSYDVTLIPWSIWGGCPYKDDFPRGKSGRLIIIEGLQQTSWRGVVGRVKCSLLDHRTRIICCPSGGHLRKIVLADCFS